MSKRQITQKRNIMKKLMMLAIALITSVSFAQEMKKERSSEAIAQKKVEKMTAELNLNKEQQERIYELYKQKDYSHKSKLQKRNRGEVKDKADLERKKAEMSDKRKEHSAAMKEILTAEQYTKWKANKAENHSKGKKSYKKKQ